jgi:hypothetical protein
MQKTGRRRAIHRSPGSLSDLAQILAQKGVSRQALK